MSNTMPHHHRPSGVLRVQVISDLHSELGLLGVVTPDAVATEADIVIQAGDMAKAPDSIQRAAVLFPQTEVLVNVGGNHDHYETGLTIDEGIAVMRRYADGLSSAECRDVIVLENEVRVVRVRDIPVRLIGCTLWTDYALHGDPVRDRMRVESGLNDYRAIKGRASNPLRTFLGGWDFLKTSEVLARFDESRAFLATALAEPFDGPTIVVTHHLPSLRSVARRYRQDPISAGFASQVDDLVGRGAALWVHGHTHDSCLWRDGGGTLVACNPAGYSEAGGALRENAKFNPRLVFDIRRGGRDGSWQAGQERESQP
jgi:predicted phosphodiesterase